MMKRHKRSTIRKRKLTRCQFCEDKIEISYRQVDVLGRFISDRGKILSRDDTGSCSAHQRQVTLTIKQARHLALLPFIVQPR